MNERIGSVLNILPSDIKNGILAFKNEMIEEIRLKAYSPVFIYVNNKEYTINRNNEILYATMEDIDFIIKKATKNSLYAYLEDIKNGYITIENGHRIGLCGRAVYENNKLINIKDISSLNIRCAGEIKGAGERFINYICENGSIKNTLIISSPKCGKTTVLRDITRLLSNISGIKIALIDERDEIASSYLGKSSLTTGERTFVLSGYLKREGFVHAVRSLAPTVIICDELGEHDDISAVSYALGRGVKVIASIHGDNIEDILKNNNFSMFERIILLNKEHRGKIYKNVKGDYHEL